MQKQATGPKLILMCDESDLPEFWVKSNKVRNVNYYIVSRYNVKSWQPPFINIQAC